MNEFLDRVANILEVPETTEELEFRSVPGWGSMMGFALFIMLEDEYGAKMTPEQFRELKTVADLMSAVAFTEADPA
jgi:acyl carrier protein